MTDGATAGGAVRGARSEPLAQLALFAVVFAGYTVGSQIGFSWFRTDAGPTFFPPAGLTLAALVLTPRRRWPAVLLAAFAAELSSDLVNDLDPVASVGYAIANSAEPLVGALMIGRLGGFAFTRQGLTAFLTGGVLLGPAVGAAIGATSSLLAADDLSWRAIAGRWWLGDALGVLVVGASLLSLGTPPPPRWPGWRRALEALVLCGGSIGGVVLVFETQQWDLAYVPILLLVAVAFRLGVRHVALTGSAMAFVIAAQATLASHAVWDELSVERTLGLVHLQLLIGIVMITALALAVEVEARDEASRDRATAESEALREQAARRRTERLARLATALTAATQLSEVAVVIGAEAATAVGAEMASLVLIGDREAAVVAPDPVDAAGAAIVAARDDRVVYVDGTAGTAETPVVHAALPVSMPRGEGLAALVFSWPDGSVLGVAERRDLEIVRELIGQAVERARLVALERSRSRRREALQVLSTAVAGAPDADQIGAVVTRLAPPVVDATAVALALVDDDRQPLQLRYVGDPPGPELVDAGIGAAGEAAVVLEQAAIDVAEVPGARPGAIRRLAHAPLQASDGDPIGVLIVGWRDPAALDLDARDRLGVMASVASQALERAALLAAAERARVRAEFLVTMLAEVETGVDVGARAERLAHLLVPRIADYVSIEPVAPHGAPLAVRHRDAALEPVLRELRGRRRGGRDGPERGPRVTEQPAADYEPADDETAALLDRLGPRSQVVAPLGVAAGAAPLQLVLGIVRPERRPYGDPDLPFLRDLAWRCGVAIEAARLLEEEHETALRLQQALLPDELISHPRIAAAARYLSGDERFQVGGDWYDTIALADGTIGLAVGDIVGKGLRAAAAMGRLRAAMAALAPHCERPRDLLERLDAFAATIEDAHFATACYAVLDPVSGRLRYACAGHPPMLLVAPSGAVEVLDAGRSWPLCSPIDARRDDAEVTMEPGSTVLLFSDGLVERRGTLPAEGYERLAAAALAGGTSDPDALCEELVRAVTADHPSEDDIVLLAVHLRSALDFAVEIPAEPARIATVRDALRRWMDEREVPDELRTSLLLSIGEAVSNSVEHAYGDGERGRVEVTIAYSGREIVAVVRDGGRWRAPEPSPVRGHGTTVMRELTTSFARRSGDAGTSVTLRFAVPQPAPRPGAA